MDYSEEQQNALNMLHFHYSAYGQACSNLSYLEKKMSTVHYIVVDFRKDVIPPLLEKLNKAQEVVESLGINDMLMGEILKENN